MLHKFFNWFSQHCLNCRQAARLISDSCERPLSFGERMKLKALTFMCPYTARYEKQIDLLHKRMGSCCEDISEVVETECMTDECKQRMRDKLSKGA